MSLDQNWAARFLWGRRGMTPSNLGHTKPNGWPAWGGGRRVTCSGAMDASPKWSLELAPVVLFIRGLALHSLWSMGSSPRAPEGSGGRWKGVRSGGASSLTFGVDGEWLQSSSGFGSSSGGSGGVSSPWVTSQTRSGHSGIDGEEEEQRRGTGQGGFWPKWLMEKGNWFSYFYF
jgi:hypothetical protein